MPSRTKPLGRRTPLYAKAPTPRKAAPARPSGTRKRRPKPLRVRLCDDADDLFSLLVRARATGCELRLSPDCRGRAEHCCHLISRKRWSVRWSLDDNGAAGCAVCHGFGHAHRDAWEDFCIRRLGAERWDALVERSKLPPQSTEELREIIAELRRLVRNSR